MPNVKMMLFAHVIEELLHLVVRAIEFGRTEKTHFVEIRSRTISFLIFKNNIEPHVIQVFAQLTIFWNCVAEKIVKFRLENVVFSCVRFHHLKEEILFIKN